MNKQLLIGIALATLGATHVRACGYMDLLDLDFMTDDHGYRISTMNLEETRDGGKSWHAIHPDKKKKDQDWNFNRFSQMDVVNDHTAFLLSPPGHNSRARIYTSSDEGRHWDWAELPVGMRPKALDFVSETHGFLLLDDNRLLVTDDACRTWQEAAQAPENMEVNYLSMLDAKRGFAIGTLVDNGQASAVLLVTRNGGKEWMRQELQGEAYEPFKVQALEDGSAIISSSQRVARLDPVSGMLSTVYEAQNEEYLGQVAFMDANTGAIVRNGVLYLTTNGGKTLTDIPGVDSDWSLLLAFSPNRLKIATLYNETQSVKLN